MADLSKCSKCKKDYKLYQSTCVTECPKGYYELNGYNQIYCTACPVGCQRCNGRQCLECSEGFNFYGTSDNCIICEKPNLVVDGKCTECKVLGCSKCVYIY